MKKKKILIESQWNLNYLLDDGFCWVNDDINRITVEFKCFQIAGVLSKAKPY